MSKYLLIYECNDYPEMGGGTQVEPFDDLEVMGQRATEVLSQNTIEFPDLHGSVRGYRVVEEIQYNNDSEGMKDEQEQKADS